MAARETVHELEVTATVAVRIPRDRGGELRTAAVDGLEAVPTVRSAALVEQREVDALGEELSVTVEADLTLHFDAVVDAEAARDRLEERVEALDAFDVLAGPYEIEAW